MRENADQNYSEYEHILRSAGSNYRRLLQIYEQKFDRI